MELEIKLNGADSGEGFAVASVTGSELTVRTTGGGVGRIELRATGSGSGEVTLNPAEIDVSDSPVTVQLEAQGASAALNDHSIEAVENGAVIAQFSYTAIHSPRIQFDGRYQCRLATDPDPYDSPFGANSSFGMYSVEGPDPGNPVEPPLDRIVRLQDPVALRKFASPVGVSVRSIKGSLSGGAEVSFQSGDSLIGQPASLGPACKFDSQDGAFAPTGYEPISDFSFSLGDKFSGGTDPALPRSSRSGPHPNNAPYADGFLRMDNVSPLTPADFGYPDASWMARSMRVPAEKVALLEGENPSGEGEQLIRDRRLQEHRRNTGGIAVPIQMVEQYTGVIDKNVTIDPTGSPSLAALQSSGSFPWRGEFFDFDTDVQCGTMWGTVG